MSQTSASRRNAASRGRASRSWWGSCCGCMRNWRGRLEAFKLDRTPCWRILPSIIGGLIPKRASVGVIVDDATDAIPFVGLNSVCEDHAHFGVVRLTKSLINEAPGYKCVVRFSVDLRDISGLESNNDCWRPSWINCPAIGAQRQVFTIAAAHSVSNHVFEHRTVSEVLHFQRQRQNFLSRFCGQFLPDVLNPQGNLCTLIDFFLEIG